MSNVDINVDRRTDRKSDAYIAPRYKQVRYKTGDHETLPYILEINHGYCRGFGYTVNYTIVW